LLKLATLHSSSSFSSSPWFELITGLDRRGQLWHAVNVISSSSSSFPSSSSSSSSSFFSSLSPHDFLREVREEGGKLLEHDLALPVTSPLVNPVWPVTYGLMWHDFHLIPRNSRQLLIAQRSRGLAYSQRLLTALMFLASDAGVEIEEEVEEQRQKQNNREGGREELRHFNLKGHELGHGPIRSLSEGRGTGRGERRIIERWGLRGIFRAHQHHNSLGPMLKLLISHHGVVDLTTRNVWPRFDFFSPSSSSSLPLLLLLACLCLLFFPNVLLFLFLFLVFVFVFVIPLFFSFSSSSFNFLSSSLFQSIFISTL
jgi:hypothetical protein